MPLNFTQARFVKGAHTLNQCLPDDIQEVAMVGRSNAGKSSALNVITGISNLAHTSKQPGRTQQINYFELAKNRYLVDLPGYGFAKVSSRMRHHWNQTLSQYFRTRQSLRGLIVLMDARHPLKDLDQQLINWVRQMEVPIYCVLTKADKLSNGRALANLQRIKKQFREQGHDTAVQLFSAIDQRGVEGIRNIIARWLDG